MSKREREGAAGGARAHLHACFCVPRAAGLTPEEFDKLWLENPMADLAPATLKMVKGERVRDADIDGLLASPFETLMETWHQTIDDFVRFRSALQAAWSGEDSPVDVGQLEWTLSEDYVVKWETAAVDVVKVAFLVRRRRGLTVDAFRAYWRNVHGPISRDQMPGLVRYVQGRTVDQAYALGSPQWDGIAHMYFAAPGAWKTMVESPYFSEVGLPDSEEMADFSANPPSLMVREHVVHGGQRDG